MRKTLHRLVKPRVERLALGADRGQVGGGKTGVEPAGKRLDPLNPGLLGEVGGEEFGGATQVVGGLKQRAEGRLATFGVGSSEVLSRSPAEVGDVGGEAQARLTLDDKLKFERGGAGLDGRLELERSGRFGRRLRRDRGGGATKEGWHRGEFRPSHWRRKTSPRRSGSGASPAPGT